MSLCVVRSCPDHRNADGWTHVAPPRQTPVTAHLRRVPDEEEAA